MPKAQRPFEVVAVFCLEFRGMDVRHEGVGAGSAVGSSVRHRAFS